MNDLFFMDVETTGLDPAKHDIIQFAAIRTSPSGEEILASCDFKMGIRNVAYADPEALKVNGYSAETWAPHLCSAPEVVASGVAKTAKMLNAELPYLVGHNVMFDIGFANAFLSRYDRLPVWNPKYRIDTVSLVWPYFVNGTLKSLSLASVCEWLQTKNRPSHNAYADVLATRDVYVELMRRQL